jgi:hypothetical protein
MLGHLVYSSGIIDNEKITLQVADGIYNVVLHGSDKAYLVATKVFVKSF